MTPEVPPISKVIRKGIIFVLNAYIFSKSIFLWWNNYKPYSMKYKCFSSLNCAVGFLVGTLLMKICGLYVQRRIKRQKGRQRSSLIFWLFDAAGGGGRGYCET